MQVLAISQCLAVIVGSAFLAVMLRTQLNVLAGALYQQVCFYILQEFSTKTKSAGDVKFIICTDVPCTSADLSQLQSPFCNCRCDIDLISTLTTELNLVILLFREHLVLE